MGSIQDFEKELMFIGVEIIRRDLYFNLPFVAILYDDNFLLTIKQLITKYGGVYYSSTKIAEMKFGVYSFILKYKFERNQSYGRISKYNHIGASNV